MTIEGVIAAVVTPFNEDGSIRLEELRRHVAWLIESGCTAITGTGSMGEAASLTRAERRQVIAAIVEAAGDETPVIAGVSAPTAEEAIGYARDAAEVGAQGLMCLPPLLYSGDEREIRAFFEEVAGATDLPVQLYNNPHASGIDLPSEQIRDLFSIDGITSVKECSGDARRIAELRQLDVDVMVGGDDWVLEGAAAGASGWVSGVVNVAPEECVELWRLASSGDLEPARALYARLAALARFDMTPKLVQYFKAAMDAVGRFGGPCRPPRLFLTPGEARRVREAVASLQSVSV